MIGSTVLLFEVCRPATCKQSDGSNTLLYGGRLRLICHSRITSHNACVLTAPFNLPPAL